MKNKKVVKSDALSMDKYICLSILVMNESRWQKQLCHVSAYAC